MSILKQFGPYLKGCKGTEAFVKDLRNMNTIWYRLYLGCHSATSRIWRCLHKGRKNSIPCTTEERKTTLMDLPREIRIQIMGLLEPKDQKSLRLVSKTIKLEVDHGIGLQVTLQGPKHWKDWNLKDRFQWFLYGHNPERRRLVNNVTLIANSAVRSLTASRLCRVSFNPLDLIQNTFILHGLSIQVTCPCDLAREMISVYNNIRCLSVTCSNSIGSKFRLSFKPEVESFRQYYIWFTRDVISHLSTKPYLEEFNISVKMVLHYGFEWKTYLGIPQDPVVNLPVIKYPFSLSALRIDLPIFTNSESWVCWKALLDQQTQLKDLMVHIGFPHWIFFKDIISKNDGTLRTLDLTLSNSTSEQMRQRWLAMIVEIGELDWPIFLPNPCQLTSIKIAMAHRLRIMTIEPGSAKNFHLLQLESLKTLDLRHVKLVAADFEHIFGNLPSLRNVCLKYYNSMRRNGNYTEAATSACQPLSEALLANRLETVHMTDYSIRACPKSLRETISTRANYKVYWPFRCSHTVGIVSLVVGQGFKLRINKIHV